MQDYEAKSICRQYSEQRTPNWINIAAKTINQYFVKIFSNEQNNDIETRLAWLRKQIQRAILAQENASYHQHDKIDLNPKNEIENLIVNDPLFKTNIQEGKPRLGHPEGCIRNHIIDVLGQIQHYFAEDNDYSHLRIIALLHDSFKPSVDLQKSPSSVNHHGYYAAKFFHELIQDKLYDDVLCVIEYHHSLSNIYQQRSTRKLTDVLQRTSSFKNTLSLQHYLPLMLKFNFCDTLASNKNINYLFWVMNEIYNQ